MLRLPSSPPRRAWMISLLSHLMLVAVLASLSMGTWLWPGAMPATGRAASSSTVVPNVAALPNVEDWAKEPETQPPVSAINAESESSAAAEFKAATEELSADATDLTNLVTKKLEAVRTEVANKSADENLRDLDVLAKRFETISSPESAEAVGNALNKALNLTERQPPTSTEPIAGEFDFDTARIDDAREDSSGKKTRYFAVMSDAQGRKQDVEVDADTGAQLVKTFALIKKYPLLETLYRKTVVALLDKLLKAEATPKQPMQTSPSRTEAGKAEKSEEK